MPWRGPGYPGEFPTLGYQVAEWIQAHCVIPDRDQRGDPYILTEEQLRFLLFYYRLTPAGRFFYMRGGQLVRPQKWGKGPLAATMICAEAVGPVLFAGWDASGDPVGRPWATPWVQVTACSEAQTRNVWRALQPMIELGVLGVSFIADTGLTRINLPSGGLIEPVTASASSRLGNTATFIVQDQTESWVQSNHGWELADNQRRNLGGTGGRFLEICNAPDPVENSVAQRTPEEPGVYIDDIDGGPGSIRDEDERKAVMRIVYGDSLVERGGWVDLERVDVEIQALIEHDPAQAERFYLNRKLASEGAAFDIEAFRALAEPAIIAPEPDAPAGTAPTRRVPLHSVITIGVDGARHEDALAIVATDVKSGFQWPLEIIERPPDADDEYEHDQARADGAMAEAFERYSVWRVYIDDQWIDHLVETWMNRYGAKRIVVWHTYRPRQIAWAVREYEQAIASGDLSHDGNELLTRHVANSRRRVLTVRDDKERLMHTLSKDAIRSPRKIDAAMAAVMSWKARGDALQAGVVVLDDPLLPPPGPTGQRRWEPGVAPPQELLTGGNTEYGPMGPLS